jgi:uncharacterized protein YgiB involved in biofilm formation
MSSNWSDHMWKIALSVVAVAALFVVAGCGSGDSTTVIQTTAAPTTEAQTVTKEVQTTTVTEEAPDTSSDDNSGES